MVKHIEDLELTPSHAQTIRMKELEKQGRIDDNVIFTILTEEKTIKVLNKMQIQKEREKSITTTHYPKGQKSNRMKRKHKKNNLPLIM